ncbi:ribosome biogenesis protein URB2 [Aspergillus candidus]|uniref:Urb2/Npa2 family-domain-containing protein n=1 Tax=Aspergillus candidus TaxID=41067 RepID=A0A2I2F305_ASPCN|nr:Urb2/Npa2 family-domain-containing protein [Aspergillus candidus]PLB35023.1 Urb2/Npa2 family-domain-containing protein [Aspergillus candidus]
MPAFAERARSSQEALLRLEKGTASPSSQLSEAAQIIGLDLALCASHPRINRTPHVQTHAAPKEEWVLRWLLKKLRMGKNYRVEPTSFLLLRQLIDLIPPKTLATTLKDQKFLGTLDLAIADLKDDVFAGLENGTTELFPADSDSSRTLGDSPRSNGPQTDKKGTKRKRAGDAGGADPMDVDDQPQTPASCFLAFIRALDCLYSLVKLLTREAGVDEVAASHLKHALKGGSESVAVTLGKAFSLAAVATSQFSTPRKTTDLQHLLYVLPAVLDLWELRSYRGDDANNGSSNEHFGKYCFESALRLQFAVRSVRLDTDEKNHVLHGVERLIALHVVLPARIAFFDRGGSGIDYSAPEPDWSAVKPVSDTFRPILDATNSSDSKTKDNGLWKTAELLPDFFDIATRSVPRDTFRRQTHEAPWLETLFVAVAELAFSVVKTENTTTYVAEFVTILKALFRVVLTRNVQLSLHTLRTHAAYTGLLKDGLYQVDWSLTALLIELGADIFLPNSGLDDAPKLLEALLEKVILHWRSGATRTDSNYDTIKNGVVIPLLRAFMSARDLPSFMQAWYAQLILVEEARSQDAKLSLFSVWEDDDVCNVYSDLMRSPLVQAHATAQMRAAAQEIRSSSGKVSDTPGAYAQFVILEAGLRSRSLNFPDVHEALASIVETMSSTLSSKQTAHWRWRLWRFARNLLENNVQATGDPISEAIIKLVDVASKSIRSLHKKQMKVSCGALECFEAYRFALTAVNASGDSRDADKFNSLTGDVAAFIQSVSAQDALLSLGSSWDGRAETLDSASSLALAYIVTLIHDPYIWPLVAPETRHALFAHMLTLATSQYHSSSTALETVHPDARFLQAWAAVVCHEYLLAAPAIAVDLIKVLSTQVKDDTSSRQLLIESLQRIPAPLVTRRQRATVLDLLQEVILQGDSPPTVTVGILSLMAKLADMPKSTAGLTSDWEPMWTMAKAVTLQRTDVDLQIMKAFRNLHRAVIAKLLVLSEDDRRRMFKKMSKKVLAKASKLRSLDRDSMDCFFLRISLSQIWIHRKQLTGVVDETELATCRQKVFNLVVMEVKSVRDQCKKQEMGETITLIKILDALEDFEDLATDNSDVEKFLLKIESYVEKSVDSGSSLRRLIRRRVLAGRGSDRSIVLPVIQCADSLPLQHMYGEEQQLLIQSTTERFRSLSLEDLTRGIHEIRELGFTGDHAEYHLLIAGLAAASLPPLDDKESEATKALSLLCTAVTESLRFSRTIEQFTFATECLDVILRTHTRSVSQWNIDSILVAVTVCASKSGPHIDPAFSAPIYIRLCRLVGTLLGLHRQKLGGRFHLILPAMQRLLNCLFARSRKRTRSTLTEKKQAQQPYWLAQLAAAHAVHFTRLLTSLCDPTVSAVSRPTPFGGSHDGLTDQTKKAKRIAGQYLQYLVMEYAQSSLRGSLAADVKAAIMPGLYAVFDVMSKDTMRALNSGLDVSGRAVFKGLYDDYVRFGKWNKG